jgi:hypothetical protein
MFGNYLVLVLTGFDPGVALGHQPRFNVNEGGLNVVDDKCIPEADSTA